MVIYERVWQINLKTHQVCCQSVKLKFWQSLSGRQPMHVFIRNMNIVGQRTNDVVIKWRFQIRISQIPFFKKSPVQLGHSQIIVTKNGRVFRFHARHRDGYVAHQRTKAKIVLKRGIGWRTKDFRIVTVRRFWHHSKMKLKSI